MESTDIKSRVCFYYYYYSLGGQRKNYADILAKVNETQRGNLRNRIRKWEANSSSNERVIQIRPVHGTTGKVDQNSNSTSNNAMSQPSSAYNSLQRSNTATKINVSPKCFGTTQYVHKDDYERERQRWQQKLDETEGKLADAVVSNADMLQLKAELNKKIVEFEKNQRPLIEQNRRLSDRNRLLQQEIKKVEEKLCHAQDDYLTLKDSHERLGKENAILKEQRAFPEKLKEFERYRHQVLEYSKCITALRTAGLEKDRRYELLVQKFKRLKKCLSKQNGDEEDRQSNYGSEGSAESCSISLDTITEDLDETEPLSLNFSFSDLLKFESLSLSDEQLLKEQLDCAHATIAELQNALNTQTMRSDDNTQLLKTIARQQEQLIKVNKRCESLEMELANSQERNDLLEFQILELQEFSAGRTTPTPFITASVETDKYVDIDDCDIIAYAKLDPQTVFKAKNHLREMRRLAYLTEDDREFLAIVLQHMENLENKITLLETEQNMTRCELKRLELQKQDEIDELKRQLDEFSSKDKKKKALQQENEKLKKQIQKQEKLQEELRKKFQANEILIKEKNDKISQLENEIKNAYRCSEEKENELKRAKMQIEHLQRQIEEITKNHLADLEATKKHFEDRLKESFNFKNDLDKMRIAYDKVKEEKAQLEQKLQTFQKQSQEKIQKLDEELQNVRSAFDEERRRLEEEIKKAKTKNTELEKSNREYSNAYAKMEKEIAEMKKSMNAMKKTHEQKLEDLSKKNQEALRKEKENNEKLRKELNDENEKLKKQLAEAYVEMEDLRSQIRPIGTQLERRYEEMRYRWDESLKKIHNSEKLLKAANERIEELEAKSKSVESYVQEIEQLKTYNHELEEQFNAQMDIIAALKKKFIQMNGANNNKDHNSSESVGWTSNSTVNSLDDEVYSSEGSGSFKESRNHA
uniref:Uncharacterized protein n=1 Tax=Acrobeloides nanus TaxID=290746 RepID=A0A914E8Z5_9BILA